MEQQAIDALIFISTTLLFIPHEQGGQVLIATAQAFGISYFGERHTCGLGNPYRNMISSLVPGIDVDEFTHSYVQKLSATPNDAVPELSRLMGRLAESGVLICILSSNTRAVIEQDLRTLGLIERFHFITGCDDGDHHKPDGRALDPILVALKKEGIERHRVGMIGDSWRDAAAAIDAGVSFSAVLTGHDDAPSFSNLGMPPERICVALDEAIASLLISAPRTAALDSESFGGE